MFAVLDNAWTVNGVPIYRPPQGGIEISHDNIVAPKSGRDEGGYMHIIWVRPDIVKVSFSYEKLTGNQVKHLEDLMQGKQFVFTYEDNGIQTINGYCGKITYKQKNLSNYASEGGVYENVQVNVVEI